MGLHVAPQDSQNHAILAPESAQIFETSLMIIGSADLVGTLWDGHGVFWWQLVRFPAMKQLLCPHTRTHVPLQKENRLIW